jgi:hypothetical protein
MWRSFDHDRWQALPLVTDSREHSGLGSRFLIYGGYGHFLFENTRPDVSCFFIEGFGEAFPFFVAPLLTLARLIREWMVAKAQSRATKVES